MRTLGLLVSVKRRFNELVATTNLGVSKFDNLPTDINHQFEETGHFGDFIAQESDQTNAHAAGKDGRKAHGMEEPDQLEKDVEWQQDEDTHVKERRKGKEDEGHELKYLGQSLFKFHLLFRSLWASIGLSYQPRPPP